MNGAVLRGILNGIGEQVGENVPQQFVIHFSTGAAALTRKGEGVLVGVRPAQLFDNFVTELF
jgi:hypothetical protein